MSHGLDDDARCGLSSSRPRLASSQGVRRTRFTGRSGENSCSMYVVVADIALEGGVALEAVLEDWAAVPLLGGNIAHGLADGPFSVLCRKCRASGSIAMLCAASITLDARSFGGWYVGWSGLNESGLGRAMDEESAENGGRSSRWSSSRPKGDCSGL
jgi:hypothetical protein